MSAQRRCDVCNRRNASRIHSAAGSLSSSSHRLSSAITVRTSPSRNPSPRNPEKTFVCKSAAAAVGSP